MSELLFEQAVAVVAGCLAVGLVLILIEIVLTPGLGLPGVLGGLFLLAAVVIAFLRGTPLGLATLGASIVILGVAGYALKITVGKRLALNASVPTGELSTEGLEELAGRVGVAMSALRPAGTARFGRTRVNVVTSGEFIEPGQAVVVVRVEGNRVRVEQADPTTQEATEDRDTTD